ncbi:FecCD family ABC transporter permease [Alteromonas sp. A079]|uniref:FecCD family ABC transporter permease n=1 Tax=Alteromonas sp. A079 TaxID=3410268 RepID=UPI003BA2F95C
MSQRASKTLVVGLLVSALLLCVVGIMWNVWFEQAPVALKQHIVTHVQLPLVITALLVGAALATSGATLQVVLRNPLADPGIVGITSGASLVAAFMLLATPAWAEPFLYVILPASCFAGALFTTFLIYRLARRLQGSVTAVILSGIAVSTLSGAVVGWLYLFSDAQSLRNLTFWLMGSLYQTTWPILWVSGPVIIVSVVYQIRQGTSLNKLYAGDIAAISSGVNVQQLTERTLLASAIAVGAAVSIAGAIAFVGLLIPHVLRLLLGHDNRLLLPLSALAGGVLLLLVACASELTSVITLPVSMITATLGGPLLVYALFKGHVR